MKKNLIKFISALLVFAFLVSTFTIFSFAAEGDEAEKEDSGIEVVYYRNYEEGWDAFNGFPTLEPVLRGNTVKIKYEETKTFEYNYYMYVKGVEATHTYAETKFASPLTEGYLVYEFDIKIDDYSDFRGENILGITMASGAPARPGATIRENVLYLPAAGDATTSPTYKAGTLSPKSWIHVAYAFNFDWWLCSCGERNCSAGINDTATTKCTAAGCDQTINSMEPIIELTVYFSDSEHFDYANAIDGSDLGSTDKDLTKTYKYNTTLRKLDGEDSNGPCASLTSMALQLPKKTAQIGQNFCFDNLAVYTGSPVPIDVAALGTNGYLVDTSREKTIEIISGSDVASNNQHVDEGVVMKLGVDYALKAGQRAPILMNEQTGAAYGAPVKIDGKIYVALEPILENMRLPIFEHVDGKSYDISTGTGSTFIATGRDTATVNGELIDLTAAPTVVQTEAGDKYVVIALDDVERLFEGRYVTYDEMGLIVIAKKDDVVSRAIDFQYMLELMQKFIFDEQTGDAYYEVAKKNTGFDHPYLIATDDTFDAMRAAYALTEGSEGYDAGYKKQLDNAIAAADAVYAQHANESGNLKAPIANPRVVENNAGYNKHSGMLNEIADYAEQIRDLALAYQITENEKYATLAYDMALSLGEWEHWGPADVRSFSETLTAYAFAYDWLYDAWTSLDYDVAKIEEALYGKGVYQGYNVSTGVCVFMPLYQTFIDPYYNNSTSSDNLIGTSGMMIASLALLGAKDLAVAENRDKEAVYDEYVATAKWVLENNMHTLIADGLDVFAPDGAFTEGPASWVKATGAFFLLAAALESTIGSDMGLYDTWGIDKTFYYALQIEYPAELFEVNGELKENLSGLLMWNYNNTEAGYLDTSVFYLAATALGDESLAAIRNKQLEKKAWTYLDLLGYKSSYANLSADDIELSLDYVFEATDSVISRDGWTDGSLYVGIMGGPNSGAYAQIDSGNFIYANKGFTWFGDLGAENPEAYGAVNSEYSYKYYRANAEGANVLLITGDGDIPYGQLDTGSGDVIQYETNEFGTYAVIDNTSSYGELVNFAKRGMLLTNSRRTFIVQDELSFTGGVHSCAWVANTAAETLTISADQKTAYLRQKIGGETVVLRASIISNYDFVFTKLSATDEFLLPNTMKAAGSSSLGGADEYRRTKYNKLAIIADDRLGFECAVVFEIVDSMNSTAAVEYEYTSMSKWDIDEFFTATEASVATRTPEVNDVAIFGSQAGRLIQQGYAFTIKFDDFFFAMANVYAAVKTYRPAYLKNFKDVYASYLEYLDYLEQYEKFQDVMNSKVEMADYIGSALCGVY